MLLNGYQVDLMVSSNQILVFVSYGKMNLNQFGKVARRQNPYYLCVIDNKKICDH